MEGKIFSYIHFNGKVGSMVKISTITDFAAKTDEFVEFGKNIAMQVAMTNPTTIGDLLQEEFIKISQKTIQMLVSDISTALGEPVSIMSFQRYDFGEI